MKSIYIILAFSILGSCAKEVNSKPDNFVSNENFYKNLMIHLIAIDNEHISPIFLVDIRGDSIAFSKIIKDNTLFLLITERCCQQCVHEELKRLQKLEEAQQIGNIVILVSYQQPRMYYAFSKLYGLKFEMYSIYSKHILQNYVLYDFPLYFRLDRGLRIADPFYVIPTLPNDMVIKYMNKMSSIISN
jgi:hypothetical protein